MRISILMIIATLMVASGIALTSHDAEAAAVEPLDVTVGTQGVTSLVGTAQDHPVPQHPFWFTPQFTSFQSNPWFECDEEIQIMINPGNVIKGYGITIHYSGWTCWFY